LYTHTGSFPLEIKTDDIYKDIGSNKNLYDTSDYPKEHPRYSNANKKVLCKMKGECAGTSIAGCLCLRSKMHSIMNAEEKDIKKRRV